MKIKKVDGRNVDAALAVISIFVIVTLLGITRNISTEENISTVWKKPQMFFDISKTSLYPSFQNNDDKQVIKYAINAGLKKYKKQWSKQTIDWLAKALYAGYLEFGIDPLDVLAIISIESEFSIGATGKNKNGTRDYGLTQINAPNWKRLTRRSLQILKKHKVWYTHHDNKYDVAINVMNCFVYLSWSHSVAESKKHAIQIYNVGPNRVHSNNETICKIKETYWRKFQRNRDLFL